MKFQKKYQLFGLLAALILSSAFLGFFDSVPARAAGLPNGSSCAQPSDCVSNYCDPDFGICLGTKGTDCTDGTQCGPGLTCRWGKCDVPGGSGAQNNDRPDTTSGNVDAGGCGEGMESIKGVCVPKSNFDPDSIAQSKDWKELASTIIKWLLTIAGVIAVVMIVVGGFWYMTAAGNDEQAEKGRKALTNSIIGLIVIMLAYAIVTVVTDTLINK